MAAESATQRLARLLTMVPWLMHRQGIDIEQAARELDVSPAQVEADLSLLFVCGTPGHMPDDLIEAEWEGGKVFLGNADTIARPLRLGVDEALALIVGLRTLAAVPGLGERDAIDRALAKLIDAAGDVSDVSDRVRITPASGTDWLAVIRTAISDRRRLHLRYLVAARDESTERDVDPMRVLLMDDHWYLEGWCHRADGVRMFRLDRIDDLQVLDQDGTPPAGVAPRELGDSVFSPAPDAVTVRLELQPGASWVVDYYPVDSSERREDGSVVATLRTSDLHWVRQLVWRLGGSATVLEPAHLRATVHTGAVEALRAYST
ncbi:WYL domain-containing protein [Yimella sp. cx-573]|nr:WYL domain-containing protein [Yimella sp. cx-573]